MQTHIAAFALYWDHLGLVLQVYLTTMLLDILFGTARAAFVEHHINSTISAKALTRKVMQLFLVAFARIFEEQAKMPLSILVAGFYLKAEVESLVENMALLGVPVPPALTQFFAVLPPHHGRTPTVKTKQKLDAVDDGAVIL